MVILPSRLERRGQEEADEISTRVEEGGIIVKFLSPVEYNEKRLSFIQ